MAIPKKICPGCGKIISAKAKTCRFCFAKKLWAKKSYRAKKTIKRIKCECSYCGKSIYRRPAKIKKGQNVFCDKKCDGLFRRKRVKVKCEKCGTEFYVLQSIVQKGGGRFCSNNCYDATKTTKVEKVCLNCGKPFMVFCSRDRKGCVKYCSQKCFGLSNSGGNNANYNSTLTEAERVYGRKIEGYGEWRIAVYKKDNFVCQKCGDGKGGNLNAHHIEAYNSNPAMRTEVSNGITFCKDCHKDFHHQYGYGNNTKAQLNEFMGVPNR